MWRFLWWSQYGVIKPVFMWFEKYGLNMEVSLMVVIRRQLNTMDFWFSKFLMNRWYNVDVYDLPVLIWRFLWSGSSWSPITASTLESIRRKPWRPWSASRGSSPSPCSFRPFAANGVRLNILNYQFQLFPQPV